MPRRWATELWGQHNGEDVWVVGTGTSLAGFDWGRLRGRVTIGLNGAVRHFPPTYHLWSDHPLWVDYEAIVYGPETRAVVVQEGATNELMRSRKCSYKDLVHLWQRATKITDCSPVDHRLWISHTVATAGVLCAWKLGARRIFLLGVDAYSTPNATYCDGTRQIARKILTADRDRVVEGRHVEWAKEMDEVRDYLVRVRGVYRDPHPGSGVFNLSAKSGVTAWEKVPVEVALLTAEVPRG